jgi:hypothetical protein
VLDILEGMSGGNVETQCEVEMSYGLCYMHSDKPKAIGYFHRFLNLYDGVDDSDIRDRLVLL